MGNTGDGRKRTLVSLTDSTVEKLNEFRDREYSYVPRENRKTHISWNTVVLRLLEMERTTRPEPARAEAVRRRRKD